jgi:uncharacterized protein YecT (DUF1311 family)
MKARLCPFFIFAILVMPSAPLLASGKIYIYDLRKECGYYFRSPRELLDSEVKCSKNNISGAAILNGSIISRDNFFDPADVSDFKKLNTWTIQDVKHRNYKWTPRYESSMKLLKYKTVPALKKNKNDLIIASLIEGVWKDPFCAMDEETMDEKDKEVAKECMQLPYIDMSGLRSGTFECWDAMFYGEGTFGVNMTLCNRVAPKHKFGLLSSWQANLIKSLIIVRPGDELATKKLPSFDCSGKLSAIEKMICESEELPPVDVKLARTWTKIMERIDKSKDEKERQRLIKEQRAWLKEREKCGDHGCLLNMYTERAAKLCTWSDESVAQGLLKGVCDEI